MKKCVSEESLGILAKFFVAVLFWPEIFTVGVAKGIPGPLTPLRLQLALSCQRQVLHSPQESAGRDR